MSHAAPVIIGDATLYCGDCRDIVPTLAGIEAVVSDPPYGMACKTDSRRFKGGRMVRGAGRADRRIIGDDAPFDPAPWLAFHEVILWGANHYAARLPVGTSLVWLKKLPHLYGTFLSDGEIGWKKGGHGVYVFNAPDRPDRRVAENDGRKSAHVTQKPIALMDWCIGKTKADAILDPYMGSGTTGVAALKAGRRFVGIEIDPTYFQIAVRRISEVARQGRLFDMPAALRPEDAA